jgi:hypothetical protein
MKIHKIAQFAYLEQKNSGLATETMYSHALQKENGNQ